MDNTVNFLLQQTKEAHVATLDTLHKIPMETWEVTPPTLNSNIAWQVGHLVITQHFHDILLMRGTQEHVLQNIDLRTYAKTYGMGTDPTKIIGIITPQKLMEDLLFIQKACEKMFSGFSDAELKEPYVANKYPHPFAKTKYEVLSCNFRHISYHIGQMNLIKRVVCEYQAL